MKISKIITKASAISMFCLLGLTTNVLADASAQVASNTVNFGQLKQGELAVAKFEMRNVGTNTLTIEFIEFSTQGMRANVKQKTAVGSSTELIVTWDTSGLSGQVHGET